MLNNLSAEMKRNGLNSVRLASAIRKTDRAVRDKISGKSQFDIYEAMSIRDQFFPGMTLEYLFARQTEATDTGQTT